MTGEQFLAVLGVVFAAFCVWLTVRIINQREKWAICAAASLAAATIIFSLVIVLSSVPRGAKVAIESEFEIEDVP